MIEAYQNLLTAALLISLRITPTIALCPPFTLLRMPGAVRMLVSLSLALTIAAANPAAAPDRLPANLAGAFVSELALGITLSVTLQIAFAALSTMGRAIDIQVGFGLAQIADPTLRTQAPLVGTLFAYAAGAVFFAIGGASDMLAIWSNSLQSIPLGAFAHGDLPALLHYINTAFLLAAGLGSAVFLTIFLIDIAVALTSRTLPQMNVLFLGFQVKTLALLVTLPFVFAYSGAGFLRLIRLALAAAPGLT